MVRGNVQRNCCVLGEVLGTSCLSWFKCELSPQGLPCVWTLDPQLVALFEGMAELSMEVIEGGALQGVWCSAS